MIGCPRIEPLSSSPHIPDVNGGGCLFWLRLSMKEFSGRGDIPAVELLDFEDQMPLSEASEMLVRHIS